MKSFYLFLLLSFASLLVMIVADVILGSKAEFINAYSVIERLLGKVPSAGTSLVAEKFGTFGELVGVLLANLAIGGILTAIARFVFLR